MTEQKVYMFLADGFEEIEGLTAVDILRRGGIEIKMVSVTGKLGITGSHGIALQADCLFEETDFSDGTMFVLPGGQPGTNSLKAHAELGKLLTEAKAAGKWVCAICAAPTVLGGLGLLRGERAVCFPGCEDALEGAEVGTEPVAVSGHVITSRGMGTAMPFALALLEALTDADTASEMAKKVVWKN